MLSKITFVWLLSKVMSVMRCSIVGNFSCIFWQVVMVSLSPASVVSLMTLMLPDSSAMMRLMTLFSVSFCASISLVLVKWLDNLF